MPLQNLQFRPGVNREVTSLSGEGGWFDCDKVRFRGGFPEKIGGWAAVSFNTFLGVCRSLSNWITLSSFNIVGLGTNLKFYLENGGSYYDITPIRLVTTNTTTFAAGRTTLNGGISSTATTITLTDATNFPDLFLGGWLLIGSEQITYSSRSGNVLSGCTRGYNGTTPAAHANGAFVGSFYLKVTDSSVTDLQPNDFVTFSSAASLGGNYDAPVLNQEYQIALAQSATVYYVAPRAVSDIVEPGANLASNNSNTGNGGAATDSTYQINTGNAVATVGTGWGTGTWGRDTWGSSFDSSTVTLQLRLWSQATFGEYLLFSPRGGAIYIWQPTGSVPPNFTQRGIQLSPSASTPVGWSPVATDSSCPDQVNTLLVSDSTRIVIAFGCNDPSGVYFDTSIDPMNIRWSNQEDFATWIPTATNQAGDYRLSQGSTIVTAIQTRQEIVVFTDTALYSMQYVGPPYVWSFVPLASNISIISPNAVVTASGVTYWMGVDKFYIYAGRVETLPCSVRKYIYDDINRSQQAQFFAGTNEGFSEVWWYYCSSGSTVVNRYVIYNYLDGVWYYGTLNRTAWLDTGTKNFPIAITNNNIMVEHESAVNNGETAQPSAIVSYIQSSDFDIGDGDRYSYVWRMVPDVTFNGSSTTGTTSINPQVRFTLTPRQNPGAPNTTSPMPADPTVTSDQDYGGTQKTYLVQEFTEIVYTRVRGRQMSFKISCDEIGTQWQLGTSKIDIRADGRR
jgi:hypothetical protein